MLATLKHYHSDSNGYHSHDIHYCFYCSLQPKVQQDFVAQFLRHIKLVLRHQCLNTIHVLSVMARLDEVHQTVFIERHDNSLV